MNEKEQKEFLKQDEKNRKNGSIKVNSEELSKFNNMKKEASLKTYFNVTDRTLSVEHEIFMFLRFKLIPTLKKIAMKNNPELFKVYGGNLCRQASFYSIYLLKEILYDWNFDLVEFKIKDMILNQEVLYEHAIVYITNEKDKSYRYINAWDNLVPDQWLQVHKLEYPTYLKETKDSIVLDYTIQDFEQLDKHIIEDIVGNKNKIKKELLDMFSKDIKYLRKRYIELKNNPSKAL
jgi:hypothetical protein